jgi:hypothetical protein
MSDDAIAAASSSDQFWQISDLAGEDYKISLQRLHKTLRPRTYLEVGVSGGATLALAQCAFVAIDPEFKINKLPINNKSASLFYNMTSDDFFAEHSPTALFGRKVDLAFLDGMHFFEYLLRDFINTERNCKKNSVIALHDCIPVDAFVGRRFNADHHLIGRSRHPDWWAGDVWKTVAILLKYRTDLKVCALNSRPTGLVLITNLDPNSTVLSDRYFNLIEEFSEKRLESSGDAYVQALGILDAGDTYASGALRQMFWI